MAAPLSERSLALLRPELAAQWHPSKNGDLTPENVASKSSRSIWWECAHGHEFRTAPFNRKDDTCPHCKKTARLTVLDDDDLTPWLHPDKNIGVNLSSLARTSDRKIWWRFECGHEQQASPANRQKIKHKNLCGPCSKDASSGDMTPLSTLPDAMAWWNADANLGLDPDEIGRYSPREVSWVCPRAGHKFTAPVVRMVRRQYCLACGDTPFRGRTLVEVRPDIDQWWHPTRNKNRRPGMTAASHKTVIWLKCPKRGHVFSREARSISDSLTCMACARLDSTAQKGKPPHETAQNIALHISLNDDRHDVTTKLFSRRDAWFVCTRGHVWEMPMQHMQNGRGCPDCPDGLAVEGVNGLDVTHPQIAEWWHEPRNRTFTAAMLTAVSRERVWWSCPEGHLFQRTVKAMVRLGLTCPTCRAKSPVPKTARLGRLVADTPLVDWYAPLVNGGNKNQSTRLVREFSKSQRRWFGKCGHWWNATPARMSKKTCCPKCGCTEPPPAEHRKEIWANRRYR